MTDQPQPLTAEDWRDIRDRNERWLESNVYAEVADPWVFSDRDALLKELDRLREAGLDAELLAVIEAHDIDHRELNSYRAKDSVEQAECRSVERVRDRLALRRAAPSREAGLDAINREQHATGLHTVSGAWPDCPECTRLAPSPERSRSPSREAGLDAEWCPRCGVGASHWRGYPEGWACDPQDVGAARRRRMSKRVYSRACLR